MNEVRKKCIVAAVACLLAVVAVNGQVLRASGEPLKADFTAQEVSKVYYEMGWDSQAEASQWDYSAQASGNMTWHVAKELPYKELPAFSSIDAKSKSSLCVQYSTSTAQNEVATSPRISILDNSEVEFYVGFRSVFMYSGRWKFFVIDEDANEPFLYTLDGFLWAQEHEFTGPSWEKFVVDLSAYSGRRLTFAFQYVGQDGEDVVVDGFKIRQRAEGVDAKVTIDEGEQVHFIEQSTGATSWSWEFEGGQPATAKTKNPVVTYQKAGVYKVTLTVGNGSEKDVLVREGFVTVTAQAPHALIGMPDGGYLSPWTYYFVPAGVPLQFKDQSSGNPTSWHWTFEGADPDASDVQNPVVTYTAGSGYGITLAVENAAGESTDFLTKAIQAGGTQEAWNIEPERSGDIGGIALGWYGNYAGSNWLGIEKFAERFAAPAVEATIDEVNIYFETTTTISPDAPVTVAICKVTAKGEPGEELASATMPVSQLVYDATTYAPTTFQFALPVTVKEPFFVVIGGFPHAQDNAGFDDIAIACLRRDAGEKNTVWHYLSEEDSNGEPTGKYQWYENSDDPLSMAVAPRLTFAEVETGVTMPEDAALQDAVEAGNAPAYNLAGQRVGKNFRGIVIRNGRKQVVK